MEKLIGLIFSLLGFVLIYWTRRKQFQRRNAFGIPLYKSFESFWLTRLFEKLLIVLGLGFLLIGILMLFIHW